MGSFLLYNMLYLVLKGVLKMKIRSYTTTNGWLKQVKDMVPIKAVYKNEDGSIPMGPVLKMSIDKVNKSWSTIIVDTSHRNTDEPFLSNPTDEIDGAIEIGEGQTTFLTAGPVEVTTFSVVAKDTVIKLDLNGNHGSLYVLFVPKNESLNIIHQIALNKHVLTKRESKELLFLLQQRLLGEIWRVSLLTKDSRQYLNFSGGTNLIDRFGESVVIGNLSGLLSFNVNGIYSIETDDDEGYVRLTVKYPNHALVDIKFKPTVES